MCRRGDLNPRPQDLSRNDARVRSSMSPVLYQAEPLRQDEAYDAAPIAGRRR
jgi:hypothetical protein